MNHIFDNKSILISGGAGFIGYYTAKRLLSFNVKKIILIDDLSTGCKNKINKLKKIHKNLTFIHSDILQKDKYIEFFKNIDIICHFAACYNKKENVKEDNIMFQPNLLFNILSLAKKYNIKRIIYASSSAVYGKDQKDISKEEDILFKNLSFNGTIKNIDELYAQYFYNKYAIECIGLRYFNVYGPWDYDDQIYIPVIPKFIKRMKECKSPTIHGTGDQSRDFVYISDVVDANILAMTTTNPFCFGKAFNVGTQVKTTIKDIVKEINLNIDFHIKPIFIEKRREDLFCSISDISLSREHLGYQPKVSFVEGIKKMCSQINSKLNIENIDYNLLLGRTPILVNNNHIKKDINGTILVTGGCGSIGSEIVRQLLKLDITKIIIYDNSEYNMFSLKQELGEKENIQYIIGDVKDFKKLKSVFLNNSIQIVFHASAYKHVPLMESNYFEAIKTNVLGTKNCADLSLKYNSSKFILVSTDKAVNPTNIMGASKRIAELYVNYLNQHNSTIFIATRFGNVLGSSGSVIPTFLNCIKHNKPLQVTHVEIIRYFMTIPEAAQLVIHASSIANRGNILLFDMGKPVKIYDLAKKIIQLYSPHTQIEITGLRPGEKMYEELLCKSEIVIPTDNKNIMKLKNEEIYGDDFINIFNNIIGLDFETKKDLIDNIVKIVPEFRLVCN